MNIRLFIMFLVLLAPSARAPEWTSIAKQSLSRLGRWGKHFSVFANSTSLRLNGSREANFTSFIKRSANWGFSFSYRRFDLMARWNYRGKKKGTVVATLGPDAFNYTGSTTMLDLNADYRLRKQLAVFISARNVFNLDRRRYAYDPEPRITRDRTSPANTARNIRSGSKGHFDHALESMNPKEKLGWPIASYNSHARQLRPARRRDE